MGLRDILGRFQAPFARLTPTQKAPLVILTLTIALVLVAITYFAARPPRAALVRGLDPDQIEQVTQMLTERGESFEVDDGTLYVPAARRDLLRRQLLERRILPEDKLYGFIELVTGPQPESLELQRRQDRIALQTELARNIQTLDGIASTNVILRAQGATGEGGKPSARGATVRVTTHGHRPLDQATVDAIVDMIVASVRDAAPDQIVVVTTHPPRSYTRADPQRAAAMSTAQFDLKRRIERELTSRVQNHFLSMGIDAAASVSVELDMKKVQRHVKHIDPDDKGGFVTSEVYSNAQGTPPTAALRQPESPGEGTPGLDVIVLPSSPRRVRPDRRYVYDEVTEEIVQAPGELARVRASVILFDRLIEKDGQWTYESAAVKDAAAIEQFRTHVANAIGAQADDVEIMYLPTASRTLPRPESPPSLADRALSALIAARETLILGIVTLLVVALVAWMALRAPPRPSLPELAAAPAPVPVAPALGAEAVEELDHLSGEEKIRALRSRIERIIERDARGVASVLRRWLGSK